MSVLSNGSIRKAESRMNSRESFTWPLRVCPLGPSRRNDKPFLPAKIKNVGKGGVKITTLASLERNTSALLQLDLEKIQKHVSNKMLLKVGENRILAQIAWRKLDLNTGLFEAGLRFIEESEREQFRSEIQDAAGVP